MDELARGVLAHTAWLYTRVHENAFFFIDLWSLVHFWSGLFLMSALSRWDGASKRAWTVLAAVVTGWELLELLFIYVAWGVFLPESLKDQLTDILVGLLGGCVFVALVQWRHTSARQDLVAAGLVALTLPFIWVGSYGYQYNIAALNSPGVNWWAFIWWAAGSLGLSAYYRLRRETQGVWAAIAITSLAYLPALFAVEYLGYEVLGIREVGTAGKPLAFDLVHGSSTLWAAYLGAPACNSLAYAWTRSHLRQASKVLLPEGFQRAKTRDPIQRRSRPHHHTEASNRHQSTVTHA